jgi:hypothetical protein
LDINSEFNLLNTNLVVPAGCQFIFVTAARQIVQLSVLAAAITEVWPSASRGSATSLGLASSVRRPKPRCTAARGGLHREKTDKEAAIHQSVMTVMALALFGAMVATAQADVLRGAPERNGNQCFTYSAGNKTDSRFGFWGACPQPAGTSTARAAAPRVRVRRSRAQSH